MKFSRANFLTPVPHAQTLEALNGLRSSAALVTWSALAGTSRRSASVSSLTRLR
ncbi:hypothetical protein [Methylosinus sp. LW4]|uniref:hypothetical protein n=1 Tax=Methylosinus sp. LW4 TaxID=136993 RepID=UPI00036A5FE7